MSLNYDKCSRRLGVEIEYNSTDNESRSRGEFDLPVGIFEIAKEVQNQLHESVEVHKWHYTNNNNRWVLKPDSSCGLEICSPPMRGKYGVERIAGVVEHLYQNTEFNADSRCSFHVHVEIEDFSDSEILNLIANWVSCEMFFFALCNPSRRINQYCIPIGFCKNFDTEKSYDFETLLGKLSEYKYYSVNLYHFARNRKKTIEFRIMGNEACNNSEDARNWMRLLLCLVDVSKKEAHDDYIKLSYKTFFESMQLLNINNYFADDEIKLWIVSKLNACLDSKQFDDYPQTFFFWKSIFANSKRDIKLCMETLENWIK